MELDVTTDFFSESKLIAIRDSIEKMNKHNHIEVLRILINDDVIVNENKNGIYVNLTDIKPSVIEQLETFIMYVNAQEQSLELVETRMNTYKNQYFDKDNKDNTT